MRPLFSLILFFALTNALCQKQSERYNVIWLDLEDMSPIMSCYGDNTAKTPNIDRLAKEGIVYNQAYSCVGVCAPSRSSIITGMFPVSIGSHNMRISPISKNPKVPGYEVVPPDYVRCFPDLLRESGIYTSYLKKADYQFSPSPLTWDEFSNNEEPDRYEFPKQRPFFKQINFWETHESQIWTWCRKNVPLVIDTSKVKVPPYLPQTPIMKLDWAYQYNNLQYTDQKIGRVIAALEKEGLWDKTILILTGDHGNGLPRGKRTVYQSGVHVPFIVRFPDKRNAGTYNNELIYLMDLGPTILSHYDIPVPKYMHGRDIFGKQKPVEPRKYAFFSADRFDAQTDIIRAVTDGRFKYIRYFQPQRQQFMNLKFRNEQPGIKEMYTLDSLGMLNSVQKTVMRQTKPAEELFDLKADPHEINDISKNKEHQAKLVELRAALDEWLRETRDLGFTSEQEIAERFWPGGVQPLTMNPEVIKEKNKITLICKTPGASIGYKINKDDSWKIYTGPVTLSKGQSLYAIAHRLGYKTSEIITVK